MAVPLYRICSDGKLYCLPSKVFIARLWLCTVVPTLQNADHNNIELMLKTACTYVNNRADKSNSIADIGLIRITSHVVFIALMCYCVVIETPRTVCTRIKQ